jgi:APA family basic amino acid/polyamine antiporter
MLLGQSRVFYSMSRDGLVPSVFSEVHPKFRTPWKSNMIFFLLTASFGAFVPEDIVGDMTSIGTSVRLHPGQRRRVGSCA